MLWLNYQWLKGNELEEVLDSLLNHVMAFY